MTRLLDYGQQFNMHNPIDSGGTGHVHSLRQSGTLPSTPPLRGGKT